MSAASIREALRGARLALSACRAGWDEAQRLRAIRQEHDAQPSPAFDESYARMERTATGAQLAVNELERFADLKPELARAIGRHFDVARVAKGPQWLAARVAEDLDL